MSKLFLRMLFYAITIVFSFKSGLCQIDQTKLTNLRTKYPWGSIYITYVPFINLSSILEDENKIKYISAHYPEATLSTLRSFLKRYKSPTSSQAIAFIEIDLNRIEAGFKRASDVGGEITSIAWSKEQVVDIADLCDKQMNAIAVVKKSLSLLETETTPILTVFQTINNTKENAYASFEVYFVLAKDFRRRLSTKDSVEIAKLPKNSQVALLHFVRDFDATYFKLQHNEVEGAREFKENLIGLEPKLKEKQKANNDKS
jgi:hypothetical protein